jgi:hypothetical protein
MRGFVNKQRNGMIEAIPITSINAEKTITPKRI